MSEQPTLFETPARPAHRSVRATSRASYEAGKEKWTSRKAAVAGWLEDWYRVRRFPPTSAELARFAPFDGQEWTALLLYVRRGLSDLVKIGAVDNPRGVDGKLLKRPCAVTGQCCYTWEVAHR